MARHLNEALEMEQEIEVYRTTLSLVKRELHRIREEYLDGKNSHLSPEDFELMDEELETITLAVENALF
jgi:hypothetical protein